MTKKLFVVLVVVAAMLVTFTMVMGGKRLVREPAGIVEKVILTEQQGATPLPFSPPAEPLAASALDQSNMPYDGVIGGPPYVPLGPGDMLWCCPVEAGDPLDDQILGVEFFNDTAWTTGAGGTTFGDTNYVYAWLTTGTDVCTFLYRVPQPAHTWPSGWGWRDMAYDGQYLYASYGTVLNCFYATPGGVVEVPANDITFAPVGVVRAVAYDAGRDWFWCANFSSNIYAFDRSGAQMASYANTLPLYGMAYDGTYLWCHSQDNTKVYQFDVVNGVYTGVVYPGCQDATGGIAGGLSMMSSDVGKQVHTLIGVTQGAPDAMYAIEVEAGGGPLGCCDYSGTCDMITEDSCNTLGGTWYASPYQCIGDECQIPVDTVCHLQWDNGSASWYASNYTTGDQQGNYFDPEDMCPDCGPDVFPFLLTQVSGVFYDFGGAGTHDMMVHIYSVDPDSCAGPGAAIYSFGPVTVTTFYPDEAVIALPEVLCLNEDFVVAFEYLDPGVCVLWTNEAIFNCISWLWNAAISPMWLPMEQVWAGIGYHMVRADGICNAGACDQGVACDLVQDAGAVASYFSSMQAGDKLAKYFDPEVYCSPPVYPYHISDVEMYFYDFAGAGTVDVKFGVNLVCQDICDGPGTQIYLSDAFTITDFYPTMAHIDLLDEVCVYEPFYITVEWQTGALGSTPSMLMDGDAYPCDTCHAWMYAQVAAPEYIEWYDFWSPPTPGCPIVRVSGYTEDPGCEEAPCDTATTTLSYFSYEYYIWPIPDDYGDDFRNERFIMPAAYGGRLDEINIEFYGATGTPDADIYVWLSDGLFPLDNNPPYQSIAQFTIPYDSLVFYSSWNTIQTWWRGITFDPGEMFHIGYSHAQDPGDTLILLSDDASGTGVQQSSERYAGDWWLMEDGWSAGDVDFTIEAVICIEAPPESTFTLACDPFAANATPGDPPTALYTVDVGAVLGYNLNVDLDCTPPAGINVSFSPDNLPPPFTSTVSCSVDVGTPYGDYMLTFFGTGSDGQVVSCDVQLTVQPPFDEAEVDFYHGMQRASNFGAVGNDVMDNFVWYGLSYLFDGSFVIATTDQDHMALDVYNCEYWDWLPTQHLDCYYDPLYNANVCYGNFCSDANIPGECDSVFIVGIMETCIDFSIKIKVYYNEGPDPITGMYMTMFEDWDCGDAYNNAGNLDPDHNIGYMYDPLDPDLVFGMMKAPYYDDPLFNSRIVENYRFVWPNAGFCDSAGGFWGLDSLYWMMTQPGHFYQTGPDSDFSILMTAGPIDLAPGEEHLEVWIDFGRNLQDGLSWSQWWHRVLRYAGFYRGDVNASDTLEVPNLDVSDLVYLIQYLFQAGPDPMPYVDQGDVNGDHIVNVADIVYLLNYIFINGPPPVDYVRFIPQFWPRTSLFENSNWD